MESKAGAKIARDSSIMLYRCTALLFCILSLGAPLLLMWYELNSSPHQVHSSKDIDVATDARYHLGHNPKDEDGHKETDNDLVLLPSEDPCCTEFKNMSVSNILEATAKCTQLLFIGSMRCKCGRILTCKVIVLTAMSDNHFRESLDFLSSVQIHLPFTPIIAYDLGLNTNNRKSLASFCNVYVKTFKFDKYPEYVRDLKTYAWKPIIINQTLPKDYEIILWCDTSCRLHGPIGPKLHYLVHQPIIPGPQGGHPFITALHNGMMHYLQMKHSRKHYGSIGICLQVDGILWFNEDLREHLLKPWLDCAMHKECIAPDGAKAHPCNQTLLHGHQGKYADCHRFDQAAYNAILTREYGQWYTRTLFSIGHQVLSKVRKPKVIKYTVHVCQH